MKMNGVFTKAIVWTVLALCAAHAGSASAVETVVYYHNDALGSPVAATGSQGEVLWREAYSPYGDRLRKEDGGSNSLWYTAKPHEADFDLSYSGARWYMPATGRFTGTDPIRFREENLHSFNRYIYANNNPYRYLDPDGRDTEGAMWNISGGGFGYGFTIGYGPHTDDKANKTHLFTWGGGKFASLAGMPFALSATVTQEVTDADTVEGLAGPGSQTSTSGGAALIAAEAGVIMGQGYSGYSRGGGAAFGSNLSLSTLVTHSVLIEPADPSTVGSISEAVGVGP